MASFFDDIFIIVVKCKVKHCLIDETIDKFL